MLLTGQTETEGPQGGFSPSKTKAHAALILQGRAEDLAKEQL